MSYSSRVLLLLSSFSPVFAIFALRSLAADEPLRLLAVVAGALSVIGFLIGIWFLFEIHNSTVSASYFVEEVEPLDEEVISYILAFIPLLLRANLDNYFDLLAFLVFYAALFTVLVQTEKVFINPLLMMTGSRFYRLKLKDFGGRRAFVVATDAPAVGSIIPLYQLANADVFVVKSA